MSNRSCVLGAVAALCFTVSIHAQQPLSSIRGTVIDSSGGLDLATVEIFGTKRRTTTSADGAFAFDSLKAGPYWLRVRRIGYVPITFTVSVIAGQPKQIEVELQATPHKLPDIQVRSGMDSYRFADFNWRRRAGRGKFFTRDDIARLNPMDPIDLALRGLPFRSRFDLQQRDWSPPPGSMMARRGWQPGCPPAISLNGNPPWPGSSLTDFWIDDIEAMEVYRSNWHGPIEFQGRWLSSACGIVVVWLR